MGSQRAKRASLGRGSGGLPQKFSKTYIANGAISVIPELFVNYNWTCIFFRESLTWRDAVRAVIPRKSPYRINPNPN